MTTEITTELPGPSAQIEEELMPVSEEMQQLRNRAWTTASSRYNASRRLRIRSRLSLATIALISALGVAVPLLLGSGSWEHARSGLTLFASLLSLFILVVAVIEGAAGFDVKADTLFRNAEDLNAFRMRLNVCLADGNRDVALLLTLTSEYEHLKKACAVNHEVVDFNLHKARNPSDFGLRADVGRILLANLAWLLYSSWWLLIIFLGAVVGFVIALSSGN